MSGPRPTHRDTLSLLTAAWVHLCRGVVGVTTLLFGFLAVWRHDAHWLFAGAVGALVWLVFALVHAFEGARCRCATCAGRLFLATRNAKHRSARRVLGSYQLHTALEVIARASYRCPHCGTVVACGSRPARSPRSSSPAPRRRSSPSIVLQARVGPRKAARTSRDRKPRR